MKSRKLWMLAAILLAGSVSVFAQNNPNEEQALKPYDSWHGGDLDSVSMTNGGLSLRIPLAAFPQRGNLGLSFMVRYSNKAWQVHTTPMPPPHPAGRGWRPIPNSGAQIVSSVDWWMQSNYSEDTCEGCGIFATWSQSVSAPEGNVHQFGGQASGAAPAYPMRSLDATGLLHPNPQTMILPNGTIYSYPSLIATTNTTPPAGGKNGAQASTVTDANGNQITINSSGWTDTMGRLIPGSTSPTLFAGIQPGVPTSDLNTRSEEHTSEL